MLQPPDVLSSSLFVDTNSITRLECIICTNVLNDPVTCRNGHGFCRNCLHESMKTKKQCPTCNVALTSTTISSNLIVKNLIEDARVYCFTRLPALEAAHASTSSDLYPDDEDDDDDDDDDDVDIDEATGKKRTRAVPAASSSSGSSSSSSRTATTAPKKAKSDHCTWTGKLQDAKQHFNRCVYAGALCGFGCNAVVRRIDMPEHKASICPKREVPCTNIGCTAVMPEPMVAAHKANDCLYEVVDCPFSSVGCKERVLRKDVDSHEEAAMKQHNRLLLQDNRSLRQDNLTFRQDILSLQQKVAEQEGRRGELIHQIVYKVELVDLEQVGKVIMQSDDKMIGAYTASMQVKKGYANDGDSCGMFLFLEDGPFPCHVSFTMEVVHWNGEPECACKQEGAITYERAVGMGYLESIPLSKLTAAASPYVKNGHVTFIITFQFLPME